MWNLLLENVQIKENWGESHNSAQTQGLCSYDFVEFQPCKLWPCLDPAYNSHHFVLSFVTIHFSCKIPYNSFHMCSDTGSHTYIYIYSIFVHGCHCVLLPRAHLRDKRYSFWLVGQLSVLHFVHFRARSKASMSMHDLAYSGRGCRVSVCIHVIMYHTYACINATSYSHS